MGVYFRVVIALHSCIEQYQNAIKRGVIPSLSGLVLCKIRVWLSLCKIRGLPGSFTYTCDFVMVFRFYPLQEIQRNL